MPFLYDELEQVSRAEEVLNLIIQMCGNDAGLSYELASHRQFLLKEKEAIRERMQLLLCVIEHLSDIQTYNNSMLENLIQRLYSTGESY